MLLTFELGGTTYTSDAAAPLDISIPLDFHGDQPNAFHLPRASSSAVDADGFVGDTRRGGSCNCETLVMNPHGNGTHTECIGHVVDARVVVTDAMREGPMPAALVTVVPERGGDEEEGVIAKDDMVITVRALRDGIAALGPLPREFFRALIIRTQPNDRSKMSALHSGANPPYFTSAAMHEVRELGVEHLLVDLPSLDREDDNGVLAAHRIFWEIPEATHDIAGARSGRTITEMIYVPDAIADGCYLLDLQIPSFLLDAAPSRPLLFKVQSAKSEVRNMKS